MFNKNQTIILIISAAVLGAVVSGALFIIAYKNFLPKPTEQDLIKEFYDIENAVHISPHSLRKKMDKGDESFVLVDLRSAQEYEKSHIIGAINIPAYKNPETSAYDEKDRIINSFRQLPKDKEIIVYCYSMPCMTGRKIGKMLAENDIYAKHLGIGWNEWRYYWKLWNHDGEAASKVEDYIINGKEPGKPKIINLPGPCGKGEFGC